MPIFAQNSYTYDRARSKDSVVREMRELRVKLNNLLVHHNDSLCELKTLQRNFRDSQNCLKDSQRNLYAAQRNLHDSQRNLRITIRRMEAQQPPQALEENKPIEIVNASEAKERTTEKEKEVPGVEASGCADKAEEATCELSSSASALVHAPALSESSNRLLKLLLNTTSGKRASSALQRDILEPVTLNAQESSTHSETSGSLSSQKISMGDHSSSGSDTQEISAKAGAKPRRRVITTNDVMFWERMLKESGFPPFNFQCQRLEYADKVKELQNWALFRGGNGDSVILLSPPTWPKNAGYICRLTKGEQSG